MAAEETAKTKTKHIVLLLHIAHVENDDPSDTRDENLLSLCPRHHVKFDGYLHATNAKLTRTQGKALSCRFTAALAEQLESESQRRKMTQSDIVSEAVAAHFSSTVPADVLQKLEADLATLKSERDTWKRREAEAQRALEAARHDATEWQKVQKRTRND